MNREDPLEPGQPGSSSRLNREPGLLASLFTDLDRPVGRLEAVERLRILETLSYGVLYEGRMFQASRGEPIALLELDGAFEKEPLLFARLLTELVRSSRLRDATILSPRGVFRHGDSFYVLFDAGTGISLATAFEFLARSGLRLSSEAVLRIGSAALAALDSVAATTSGTDEGYHGLLTPENIFLGEGQVVRVRGFGFWAGGIARTGLLGPGDLRYLAPGQRRTGVGSARSDLLSLGTILFEAVVGFPAFDAPPEEEDLTELRGSVEELQRKADTAMQDLYQVILSCLTAPGVITMPYRARLRKAIDTLFVREAARDRPFGALTLEDLGSRVKQRRPAIVKAVSMSLLPADSVAADSELQGQGDLVSAAAPEDSATVSAASSSAAPEELPPLPPEAAVLPPQLAPVRRRRIPGTLWLFGGATIALAAFAVIFWNSWPQAERAAVSPPATAAPAPVASPLPAGPALLATTSAEAPVAAAPMLPSPVPTTVPAPRPSAASARASVAERRAPGTRPRQGVASKLRGEKPGTAPRGETGSPPASVPRSETLTAPGSAATVAPGALVPLATSGLVAPVLLEKPENPRYDAADPRPPVERLVLLEILVNDLGRVRGSRVVRADRLPPGFFGVIERHLAALRFRPAEVGGVPVRVWMPYELRYWAP